MSDPFTYSREEIIDGTGWPDDARFVLVTDATMDSAEHEHRYMGQTLRHSHAGGDQEHGYYEHAEDAR